MANNFMSRFPSAVQPEWRTEWAMDDPSRGNQIKMALRAAQKQREQWLRQQTGPRMPNIGSGGHSIGEDDYFAAKQNEIDVAELGRIAAGKGPLETRVVGGEPQALSPSPRSGLEQAAGERGVQVPPSADITGADVEMARRAKAAMVRSLLPVGEPPLTPPAQMPTAPPNRRFGAELAPLTSRGGVQAFTETSPAFTALEGRAQQSALQRAARERAVTGAVTPAEEMAMEEHKKQAELANELAIAQENAKANIEAARIYGSEAARMREWGEPEESVMGLDDLVPDQLMLGQKVRLGPNSVGAFMRWDDAAQTTAVFKVDGREVKFKFE